MSTQQQSPTISDVSDEFQSSIGTIIGDYNFIKTALRKSLEANKTLQQEKIQLQKTIESQQEELLKLKGKGAAKTD